MAPVWGDPGSIAPTLGRPEQSEFDHALQHTSPVVTPVPPIVLLRRAKARATVALCNGGLEGCDPLRVTTGSGPVFSILSSAFRTEDYLAETIDSVVAQTFTDWELILVDNGMSDEVVRIVENAPTTRVSG